MTIKGRTASLYGGAFVVAAIVVPGHWAMASAQMVGMPSTAKAPEIAPAPIAISAAGLLQDSLSPLPAGGAFGFEPGASSPSPPDPTAGATAPSAFQPAPATGSGGFTLTPPASSLPSRSDPVDGDAPAASVVMITDSRSLCAATVATCPFDQVTRGFNFTSRTATDLGMVDVYATVAGSSRGSLTPQDLVTPGQQGSSRESRLVLFGLKGKFLDGKVNFTTELGWSESWRSPLYEPAFLQSRWNERDGFAHSHKLEVKVVDSPSLAWTIAGEYSAVSEGYFAGQIRALRRPTALPGHRLALSTAVKLRRFRLTGQLDDYRTSFGTFATRRVGVEHDGITLRLASRQATIPQLAQSPLLGSRSISHSLSLDLDIRALSPSLVAGMGDLSPLVPTLLTLQRRAGRSEEIYDGSVRGFRRASLEAFAMWDTPIGDTTLSYWSDHKSAARPEQAVTSSRLVQLSHSVRLGHWLLGVDGLMMRSASSASGFADSSWSGGGSIAYFRRNGPEFKLQLGREQTRMRMDDESYFSTQDSFRLTASLDLSRYLQKRFERPDLQLRAEYRKRLEGTDYSLALPDQALEHWADGYDRDGFLLSFGMKL